MDVIAWWDSLGGGTTQQSQTYAPNQAIQGLNQAGLANIQGVMGATGQFGPVQGMGAFMNPSLFNLYSAQPGSEEFQTQRIIANQAFDPWRMTPGASFPGMGPGAGPLQSLLQGGPQGQQGSINDAYRNFFNQIAAPELANNATISGYGGRGSAGYGELMTRYLASLAPTAQAQGYNQWAGGMQMAPGIANQNLQRMGLSAQMYGLPRMGRLQGLMNAQNVANSALGNIPITNYGTTMGTGAQQRTMGPMGSALTGIGALGAGLGLASQIPWGSIASGIGNAASSVGNTVGNWFGSNPDYSAFQSGVNPDIYGGGI